MFTRRTLTRMGITGLATLGTTRIATGSAQTPVVESPELSYRGMLATSNLPELPTAPPGECAVVMHASGRDSSAAAVFHNGGDENVYVNAVTATGINEDGAEDSSVPEDSLHAPIVLKPGEHGVATVEFPELWQEYTDVAFELELVSESDVDPTLVNMPVMEVQLVNVDGAGSMNLNAQNRSQNILAEGSGFTGIFFDDDGEIADWFTVQFMTDLEPGERDWITHASTSLRMTYSFMVGFTGRIAE